MAGLFGSARELPPETYQTALPAGAFVSPRPVGGRLPSVPIPPPQFPSRRAPGTGRGQRRIGGARPFRRRSEGLPRVLYFDSSSGPHLSTPVHARRLAAPPLELRTGLAVAFRGW